MNLDAKLRRIDFNFRDSVDAERAAPFKAMEEKMLKYKREMDIKYQNDLEAEVRRLREFESRKIRFEVEAKYRN